MNILRRHKEPELELENHGWAAEVDRLKAETPPYPAYPPLPPLSGDDGPCPKCGSRALTIDYHGGPHRGCVDGRFDDWHVSLSMGLGLPSPETVVSSIRWQEQVPEHHDRRCVNCKYGWTEAPVA